MLGKVSYTTTHNNSIGLYNVGRSGYLKIDRQTGWLTLKKPLDAEKLEFRELKIPLTVTIKNDEIPDFNLRNNIRIQLLMCTKIEPRIAPQSFDVQIDYNSPATILIGKIILLSKFYETQRLEIVKWTTLDYTRKENKIINNQGNFHVFCVNFKIPANQSLRWTFL